MTFRLKSITSVIALGLGLAVSSASATSINFDIGVDTSQAGFAPLLTNGDALAQNGFYIGTASTKATAQLGDLVGSLVDGTDTGVCQNITCPSNNATTYLAMIDDGLPFLQTMSGDQFKISSFDASFIAGSGAVVPNVALLLRVYGFVGNVSFFEDVLLGGFTAGALQFSTYTLSNVFASRSYDEVDFYGYACDANGSCNRSANAAQFALDNINVAAVTPVPEPETFALMAAGLIALGLRRRRSARS